MVGDALESSRSTRLATGGGSKVGDSHKLGAVMGDQRATGITTAGGLAVGGPHADDVDNIVCVRVVDGKGTCGGDSGGPLVTHDGAKLVGVTNWVSGAGCQAGHPAGFQRVTYHLDWIRDRTGIAYY